MITEYWKGEHGYDTYYTDNAFCAYATNGDEFFIADFFVQDRSKGKSKKFHDEIKGMARQLGCKYITGNIFVNHSWENFNRKVKVHLFYGYSIVDIIEERVNKRVIVRCEL